ncbi:MAG: J domain-containing protein [Bdellovibrionales bacterium]|nr:J domain-containing protein [Bdellovibrionales bacterium]MBT3527203.1 J domain-containing protein [Bdellovibrionales bacterium]MBT7765628.1 J domain-containing protein [Bdellovibrionales bacterium]
MTVKKLGSVIPNILQQTNILMGFIHYAQYLAHRLERRKTSQVEQNIRQRCQKIIPRQMVEEFTQLILTTTTKGENSTPKIRSFFFSLGKNLTPESKRELLRLMVTFTQLDGVIDDRDMQILEQAAMPMYLSRTQWEQELASLISNLTVIDRETLYDTLGVTPEVGPKELHRAYLNLAAKFHPDRYVNHNEEAQESAKEKFQDVVQAYQKLK